jgi:hypothetical protein
MNLILDVVQRAYVIMVSEKSKSSRDSFMKE